MAKNTREAFNEQIWPESVTHRVIQRLPPGKDSRRSHTDLRAGHLDERITDWQRCPGPDCPTGLAPQPFGRRQHLAAELANCGGHRDSLAHAHALAVGPAAHADLQRRLRPAGGQQASSCFRTARAPDLARIKSLY